MPWMWQEGYPGEITIDAALGHTCESHPQECSHWYCTIGHACMVHCPCERCQSSVFADPRTKAPLGAKNQEHREEESSL